MDVNKFNSKKYSIILHNNGYWEGDKNYFSMTKAKIFSTIKLVDIHIRRHPASNSS